MSRIGKKPVEIPTGVEVKVDGLSVSVKGTKGSLERVVHQDMIVKVEDGMVVVERKSDQKQAKALHGLTRSLLANMIKGVNEGFSKDLEITGTGYRAAKQGDKLVLTVGLSHTVEIQPDAGIEFDVPVQTKVTVKGIDKEAVGQTAADIRAVRPPDPYKGKGIRYAGEQIKLKPGKAGKA